MKWKKSPYFTVTRPSSEYECVIIQNTCIVDIWKIISVALIDNRHICPTDEITMCVC